MKHVLRIFRKDLWCFWPHATIFLALLVLRSAVRRDEPASYFQFQKLWLLDMLATLACCVLVIGVIHEERPTGGQYWFTRPIAWQNILAAKALYFAAVVNLPVLVCQSVALAINGFSPLQYWYVLAAKQVFFTAFLVLPAAALAAMTRDLGRTILAAVATAFGFLVLCAVATLPVIATGRDPNWGGMAWIVNSASALLVLAGTALVLVVQYRSRKLRIAFGAALATAILAAILQMMPPWQPAFTLQKALTREPVDTAALAISFDREPRPAVVGPRVDSLVSDPSSQRIGIPIRIGGPPSGMEVAEVWMRYTIEGDGEPWNSGWSANSENLNLTGQRSEMRLNINRVTFERFKDQPIRLRGSCDLVLLTHRNSGKCVTYGTVMRCLSPTPQLALVASYQHHEFLRAPRVDAIAPYPASPWFGILTESLSIQQDGTAHQETPVAFVQRDFDFPAIRLADWAEQSR